MDRQIVYPGQIPLETDLLNTNRNTMIALGKLAGAVFGTSSSIVNGLAVVPTSPASLSVNVNAGEIYSLQNVDNTAYSSLPADTTDTVVKQGILLQPSNLSCPAPTTAGFSINYLIEATYQDNDTGSVVLPYYNASNPSQAYSGPNNSGTAQATSRQGKVVLQAKAGVAAATGSQTTPAVDAGYVALAVVTVANGQATITAGSITAITSGQILGSPVSAGRLLNIQKFTTSGTYTPTPGTNSVIAEVIGGGGAGGGAVAAAAGQGAAGGGGGSGSRGISTRITSGFSGTAVTVGAGGAGTVGGAGGNGGTSSFGSFISAPGGSGAIAGASIPGPGFGQQGFGATFPTGSAILTAAPGFTAKPGVVYSSAVVFTGQGADTIYGQGGNASGTSSTGQTVAGNSANGPGAGGGGAGSTAGGSSATGGSGASGMVIVYEYT